MKKLKIKKLELIKAVRMAGRVTYGLIFAVLILIAVALVISTFNLPGSYKLLIVKSGSMEPNLHLGSVVITRSAENYQKMTLLLFQNQQIQKF